MRGITNEDLHDLGAQLLLCNTYHLHLRPGEGVIESAGGLHTYLSWDKPILTDSGGFQVFSLRHRLKIRREGVFFRSHLDGSEHFLGPEEATRIQHQLGSDIIMCFDECPPSTAKRSEIEKAVDRTLRWADECKKWHKKLKSKALLFGIVQGGLHWDLREKCTEELINIGFDGYAIGGLAVGETEEEMFEVLKTVLPLLPEDAPRYLMGVGLPDQLKRCIQLGIDMFDCVLPMRLARHGTIWLKDGAPIRITKEEYLEDHSIIDPNSPSPLSRKHLKSYLCHLLRSGERAGETIACMQNMGLILKLFADLRREMEKNPKPTPSSLVSS